MNISNGTPDTLPPHNGKSHEKCPLPLKSAHLHPLAIAADLLQLGTRGDQSDHREGGHHRLFSPGATCQVLLDDLVVSVDVVVGVDVKH